VYEQALGDLLDDGQSDLDGGHYTGSHLVGRVPVAAADCRPAAAVGRIRTRRRSL
jgi:hypothetical protein